MSNAFQRKRFFEQYAKNLSLVNDRLKLPSLGGRTGVVVCPICFRLLDRAELDIPQAITLDHVPPEKLGGRIAEGVLLCGQCNSELGTSIDAHLLNTNKLRRFAKSTPGISVDGGAFGSAVCRCC